MAFGALSAPAMTEALSVSGRGPPRLSWRSRSGSATTSISAALPRLTVKPGTASSRPRGATTISGFPAGSRPGSVAAHCGRYLLAARGGALAAPLKARLGQRCYPLCELSIR